MPTIGDFPTLGQDALAVFGEVFDTEPARHHGAEYLTGLSVDANKPVSGRRSNAKRVPGRCPGRRKNPCGWGRRGSGTSANRGRFPT